MTHSKKDAADSNPAAALPMSTTKTGSSSSSSNSSSNSGGNSSNSGSEPAKGLNASERIAHPLYGLSREQLVERAVQYCKAHGIDGPEDVRAFMLGGQLAGFPTEWDAIDGITNEEKDILRSEIEKKWRQPAMLYFIVFICSLCATVQGMDETVVNGAQSFYKHQFGIGGTTPRDTWLLGFTNGAPYIACALIGCWLTHPLNKYLGRKGTLAACQFLMVICCLWQAFTNTWWHLAISRIFLGVSLGPISATTPMFSAECSPPKLRGALVMQWQLWTAFGVMLGYAVDLALYDVPDRWNIHGLNWRLMLASAGIPALVVFSLIWLIPESPRWLLGKGRHRAAYTGLCTLRYARLQAARDIILADATINAEETSGLTGSITELITRRRNRNAFIGSEICMMMQQFCGINVVAYYSTEILLKAKFPIKTALICSFAFGGCGFVFSWAAFKTIDTFGRRNLLLTTFPLMTIFLLWTAFSFLIPQDQLQLRIGMILAGLMAYASVYAPGEGPVPFTYSAEAYPLYIRSKGMSCATATTWFFNFILAVTWPSLEEGMTPTGGFSFYAAWNLVGFFLVLFFLPETKGLSLEDLDAVFDVPLRDIISYGQAQMCWFVRRDDPKPTPPRRLQRGRNGSATDDIDVEVVHIEVPHEASSRV